MIVQGHIGGNWSQNSNPGLLAPSIAEGSFDYRPFYNRVGCLNLTNCQKVCRISLESGLKHRNICNECFSFN